MACGTGNVTYEACTTYQGTTCVGGYDTTSDGQKFTCSQFCDGFPCTALSSYCLSLTNVGPVQCGSSTCNANECCNCSGMIECLTLVGAETCASFGCAAAQ